MSVSYRDMVNDHETKIFLEERFLAYTFLASAYRSEITTEFLQALKANPPQMQGELGEFFATLADADLEATRVDLAAEYAALFLSMSAHPVAPYESVYTSDKHLLMQDAYQLVMAEYARAGFKKGEQFGLADDHIALEFEFMAALIQRTLRALEAGDSAAAHDLLEQQQHFFEIHLQNWVPRFCNDCEKWARTKFYRGLASLTRDCLTQEKAFFS
jgi:TorA-specific chaperone